MTATTVWVLAADDDPSLTALDPAAPGTRFVLGTGVDDFRQAPHPDALLVCGFGREQVEPVWRLAPDMRWIHTKSAGVEGLLFPDLQSSATTLTNGRGVFSTPLAEFAIGAILFFARGFRRLIESQRRAQWQPFSPREVAGRVVGVVGFGDIGQAVATRAHALGMNVLAWRRSKRATADESADEVFEGEGLMDVLERAEYVVLCLPLTQATRGLIAARQLASMRRDAIVVNVGRGAVVDEAALLTALREGRLAGAALDVFESEPLPEGHEFYSLDNVLLSPHCADKTAGRVEAAVQAFLTNLERFRQGRALANVVDMEHGY